MCGIAGIVRLSPQAPRINVNVLEKMRKVLNHRGPDDSGIYQDEFVGLVSTRLSILDLSSRGKMPMSDSSQLYWIVHNGEIYNYAEIREDLEKQGFVFKSRTDTEVILKGFRAYGEAILDKLNGMFAFAIWDAKARLLFAARDRFGIKPFYYTIVDQLFYFASELKVFFAAGLPAVFNESQRLELLYFRYIAGALTPYQNIFRLLPGHYIKIDNGKVSICVYYDHQQAVIGQMNSRHEKFDSNQDEIYEFRRVLSSSVSYRMISDVPVGVMLSGGLDSSSIAALLARHSKDSVHSFTIRFREKEYDEGEYARLVAKRWNLKFHEIYFEADEIPRLLIEATWWLDEPLVHVNDIGILKIARYAREHVKVLLSGEGADETLGGYIRYRFFRYPLIIQTFPNIFRDISLIKHFRRLEKSWKLLGFSSPEEKIMWSHAELFPEDIGEKRFLPSNDAFAYRWSIVRNLNFNSYHPLQHVLFYDQHTYLQSILDRNDRMTMGASIECRVPFLDHRLVLRVWRFPVNKMFKRFRGKEILRRAMCVDLPQKVLNHRKWGFGIPLDIYMRNHPMIRGWVEAMVRSDLLDMLHLNRRFIEIKIRNFLKGDQTSYPITRQLLMIYIWKNIFLEKVWSPESFK